MSNVNGRILNQNGGNIMLNEKRKLKNKAIDFLKSFGETDEDKRKIEAKFRNINGKTGRYNVPDDLWQKRTARKNRVLISWKTVKKNGLTLEQLETFYGGVVVEFINDDYFKEDPDDELFNKLKSRLGSDEIVSSMISIRNEDGTSSSQKERAAMEKLEKEFPDYKEHIIKRKGGVRYRGTGNDVWEGFIYYSIKGGQQDTRNAYDETGIKPPQLFNPASEYANEEVSLDIDLVLIYFAMFSIDKDSLDTQKRDKYEMLLKRLEYVLENTEYDEGNLLEYCRNHPSLLLDEGKLYDPIQVEEIKITDFAIDDKNDPRSIDIAHDEAVNKEKYYFDKKHGCILTAARPTNLFWSRHSSNMMQQNYTLEEYFMKEEERVKKRKEKLNYNKSKKFLYD
ncbi:hypothetical protein Aboo_1054 [Aciduliprofundum boonei T469]|uniref:Uncharacterized protein n=2 Tax=Candidatus Aciduliprofundum boonei TaxID=379547 RepID=D3T9T4_ACIB4|nr:hypothetical protein Aboo_1054 [Aciduliprofundum boonei T469]